MMYFQGKDSQASVCAKVAVHGTKASGLEGDSIRDTKNLNISSDNVLNGGSIQRKNILKIHGDNHVAPRQP